MRPVPSLMTRISLVASAIALMACEPGTIAPLPTPVAPPDDAQILTSSSPLTVESDADAPRVAIIGLAGAVAGAGEVQLTNRRSGAKSNAATADLGTFVTQVFAYAKDEVEVVYIDGHGTESEPTVLVVGEYPQAEDSETTGGAIGLEGEPAQSYAGPKRISAASTRDDAVEPDAPTPCEGEDCQGTSDPTDENPPASGGGDGDNGKANEVKPLKAVPTGNPGEYELAGYTSPLDIVILANETSGAIYSASAAADGAFSVVFPAVAGDRLVLFAQSANDGTLTSPAQELVVE